MVEAAKFSLLEGIHFSLHMCILNIVYLFLLNNERMNMYFVSSKKYKAATAFMLAHPYGFTRIMSSYNWNIANDWQGPPAHGDGSTKSVPVC